MDIWLVLFVVVLVVAAVAVGLFLVNLVLGTLGAWFRRQYTERVVVGQIAAVVRQNLPLPTALTLAAGSERGWARLYLRRIARLVAQGLDLAEAMRLAYPDCSSLVLSLVAVGQRAGQLPAALDQAETYLTERARRRRRLDMSVWPYLVAIIGFTIMEVSGIMVAVMPKFKEIFKDFNTELPGLTLALIEVSEWFVQGRPPGWVCLVLPIPVVIYLLVRRRRFPKPGLVSRLGDWLCWRMPGAGRMAYGDGMAMALRTVRLAVASGMNLEPAAQLAADLDVNLSLRRRWKRFAELLATGTDVGQASQGAGLGRVATTALLTGQRTGNMDAALRYAADYYEALISRWWIVVTNLAWPVSTLVMATIVGFVVLALFLPLVALINSAAGYW